MPIKAYDSGTDKSVTDVFAYESGTDKSVQEVIVHDSGTDKTAFKAETRNLVDDFEDQAFTVDFGTGWTELTTQTNTRINSARAITDSYSGEVEGPAGESGGHGIEVTSLGKAVKFECKVKRLQAPGDSSQATVTVINSNSESQVYFRLKSGGGVDEFKSGYTFSFNWDQYDLFDVVLDIDYGAGTFLLTVTKNGTTTEDTGDQSLGSTKDIEILEFSVSSALSNNDQQILVDSVYVTA